MPSLYGFTSNANVRVGNTTGLYQQPGGSVAVLSSAQVLLNNLSQNGNVNFALDPAYGNTKVLAYTADNGVTVGTYGSDTQIPVVTVTGDGRVSDITMVTVNPSVANYGNANVAAYLPTYTGSLENSSSVISLRANAAAQQSSIDTLDSEYTSLNATVISQGTAIGVLQANAATQAGQIATKANITGQVFTGNVQAPYFIGDGSQLTNLNVPSGSITLTGNVTGSGTTGSPINTTIAASGVTPGSYGSDTVIPCIVVGLDGRITQITTNAISGGGSYGNANVAAYLPIYNGPLENSTSIINLWANAAAQADQIAGANAAIVTANTAMKAYVDAANTIQSNQIQTLSANLGAFEAYANATFSTTTYSNTNVAAYLTTASINTTGNLQGAYILGNGSLLTNLPVQPGTYSNTNVAAYLTTASISTTGNISANKFTSSYFDATNSAGGALRNASGTPQLQWGAGGGNNVTLDVSTNMNGTNAQIDISPTGTGHVHIKPTGSGSIEIAPTNPGTLDNLVIGSVTPRAGTFTTLQTSGNITANTGGYFVGDGSQLTNLPTQTASGPAGGDLTGTYPNPTLTTSGVTAGTYGSSTQVAQVTFDSKGRATSASNVTIIGTTPGGLAGGDLTGTYPSPTLTTSGVTADTYGSSITVPQYIVDAKGRITSASNVAIAFPAGFSGNLAGNILYDSVNGRTFANAFPLSTPLTSTALPGSVFGVVSTVPVYTSGNLTQPAGGQVIGMAMTGNVNFLTNFSATNRTTNLVLPYLQAHLTSSNTAVFVQDRLRSLSPTLDVNLNGKSWGNYGSTMTSIASAVANGATLNILGNGLAGGIAAVGGAVTITPSNGAANVTFATGTLNSITHVTTGTGATLSNIGMARMFTGFVTGQGNLARVDNAAMVHVPSGWVSANVSLVTNAYALFNEDSRSTITTNGNININNTATTGLMKLGIFTVAQLTAIVGSAGQVAAVSNGTGKNNGQLAYWDVTNTRWSWVDTNLAVS